MILLQSSWIKVSQMERIVMYNNINKCKLNYLKWETWNKTKNIVSYDIFISNSVMITPHTTTSFVYIYHNFDFIHWILEVFPRTAPMRTHNSSTFTSHIDIFHKSIYNLKVFYINNMTTTICNKSLAALWKIYL